EGPESGGTRGAATGEGPTRGAAPAAAAERPWQDVVARIPQISLAGGRVRVVDGAGRGRELSAETLEGSLSRRWIRGGVQLSVRGELRDSGDAAGRFRIEGHSAKDSALALEVDELSLAAAGAWLGGSAAELAPRGRASGSLQLDLGERGLRALALDVTGTKLHLQPQLGGAARPLDLASVRVAAKAAPSGGDWNVSGRATLGRLPVPFEATVGAGRL